MASQGQSTIEQEVVIFKKHRHRGQARWFVRVACNILEPRVYGPFPDEHEAERFRDGTEFELRKLLDCQLPILSGESHSSVLRIGL